MHRIGTAGWSIPTRTPREGSHLQHYACILNCAEINSTFYRPHRRVTWERWLRETPADFRFAVKAPKSITHEAKLQNIKPLLTGFLHQLEPILPKLGPLLFQLPPSLPFDSSAAHEFFAALRSLYLGETALEPRHASWFTQQADSLLRSRAIARVAADPAKASTHAAEPGGDTALIYYRLHGSPRMYYSSYDEAFLSNLAGRLVPRPNTWVIFDNTAHGHAYTNALRLQHFLSPGQLSSR